MTTGIDLTKIQFPDVMDLRTASIFLEMSEMRVRTLARDGDIKATKTEDGTVAKWSFKKADLEAFKATPRTRKATAQRGDGKAWIIHVKYEVIEKVKAALKPFSIELEPRYDYAHQKEYRIKRQAALKGSKAPAVSAPVPTPAPTVKK